MDRNDSRSDAQQLVHSFVEFLRSELSHSGSVLGPESAESVEVAVQCLETAYTLPPPTPSNIDLYKLYSEAVAAKTAKCKSSSAQQQQSSRVVTVEDKAQAEQLKTEGNSKMREESFAESIQCYTKAIEKDPTNAVYHCNRAAAYSKLQNHEAAIQDCQKALTLEPHYSKAYGRMGLAYSSLDQHREARDCYKKALEIEPDNDGYTSNLQIAEEKLTATPQQPAANPLAGLLSGGGGLSGLAGAFNSSGSPDLAGLFQNPALMNMATQLMADPNMQNMMTNILGNSGAATASTTPSAPPPTAAPAPAPPSPAAPPADSSQQPEGFPGIDALLTAGRQLAEQMQNQHPELLQQLRSQMGQPPQQPPPQP